MTHNIAYALCRWDYISSSQAKFYDKIFSQDTWIFKGPVKKMDGNFQLGYPRCDQCIAYEIKKAGYILHNPSRQIKTYHLHNSKIRNYSFKQRITRPGIHVPISSLVL